jgi:hypothetical protein
VGTGIDTSLWVVSRIASLLLLLLVLAACVLVPILRKKIKCGEERNVSGPFRMHKVRRCLYDFFCCGSCCPRLHHSTGFDQFKPTVARMLRVTLISASDIQQPADLYFEVFTEPVEGHPKNSRIHRKTVQFVDLGYEKLELDWFGDEECLVLHAVQYNGNNQCADAPMGELRIPRESLVRYAREAAGEPDSEQAGTRSFPVKRLNRSESVRKNRFRNSVLPESILGNIFTQLGEEQGIELPKAEELAKLREQNATLQQENTLLRTQAGASLANGTRGGAFAHTLARQEEIAMRVALRFDVVPRARAAHAIPQVFRAPSQEDDLATFALGGA